MSKVWVTWMFAVVVVVATALGAGGQTFTTLVNFDGGIQGGDPEGVALVQGQDGNFYGTTAQGGSSNNGTVFMITAQGALTILYSFCPLPNCVDGSTPMTGVVLGTDGNFYGSTASGGLFNRGTVFQITPTGILSTLYSFCAQANCLDGNDPNGVIQATDGNFYGTTQGGGTSGRGTVFQLTTSGRLTTVHSFCPLRCLDGYSPRGSLIQATDGNLYGTTSAGGQAGGGTVFRVAQDGAFTYRPVIDGNGGASLAGLAEGSDGSLYGTTIYGGSPGDGTIFRVTPQPPITVLFTFCPNKNCTDGAKPTAPVMQATDGNLYGATTSGGDVNCSGPASPGCGTIFQASRQGLIPLHTFESSDGSDPNGGLLQGSNVNQYGTTSSGGSADDGTVFSIDLELSPFAAFVQNAGAVGTVIGVLGQGFTGTTGVSFNGVSANFSVVSDTYLTT